jgi:hypothetical protein
MNTKKFIIDGREYESYQLSNRQLVDLIRDCEISNKDRSYLMDKVLNRFEYETCPRSGETDDDVFARFFSDYVNNCSHNECRAAERMASEHRILQSEMFQLCMAYIKNLAENAKEGRFDARNEYACKTSQKMLDYLDSINYPY